jgi:hypothetical protein
MQLNRLLSSLLVAASLAGAGASGGCVVRGEADPGVVVESEPPPPQEEVVVERPGFTFIRGRHYWVNGRWEWRGGRYERERPGQVWEAGRWDRRGRGHVWVEGRWRRR